MIAIRGLVKLHGARRVLDGIDLDVRRGEVAAVIGPSGGGKSTLLRCINGLESFDEGRVEVLGHALAPRADPRAAGEELRALRARLGMVFQQFHLFPHMSALDNVLSGPVYVRGQTREQALPAARALLERVGLGQRLEARPAQLSGGQQQRVAIARALALEPEAMLFDEPTSALDPLMAAEVTAVMADLARGGQTMVVVTHSMSFAREVAHTVHVLADGRVVESGPAEQMFAAPQSAIAAAFLSQARRV